jgi:hypothetical protein
LILIIRVIAAFVDYEILVTAGAGGVEVGGEEVFQSTAACAPQYTATNPLMPVIVVCAKLTSGPANDARMAKSTAHPVKTAITRANPIMTIRYFRDGV